MSGNAVWTKKFLWLPACLTGGGGVETVLPQRKLTHHAITSWWKDSPQPKTLKIYSPPNGDCKNLHFRNIFSYELQNEIDVGNSIPLNRKLENILITWQIHFHKERDGRWMCWTDGTLAQPLSCPARIAVSDSKLLDPIGSMPVPKLRGLSRVAPQPHSARSFREGGGRWALLTFKQHCQVTWVLQANTPDSCIEKHWPGHFDLKLLKLKARRNMIPSFHVAIVGKSNKGFINVSRLHFYENQKRLSILQASRHSQKEK